MKQTIRTLKVLVASGLMACSIMMLLTISWIAGTFLSSATEEGVYLFVGGWLVVAMLCHELFRLGYCINKEIRKVPP